MIRVLLLLVMLVFAAPVEASEITGPATAVDSTVIAINRQRIMLFGIDSVMRKQDCMIGGKVRQCWPAAMRKLEILVDQGRPPRALQHQRRKPERTACSHGLGSRPIQ